MKKNMDKYAIARKVVLEYIKTKDVFYLSDIKMSILKNNGIMRTSLGVTVKEYLEDFDDNGIVKWTPTKNDIMYQVLKR
jgi:hypothetical protein